MAEHSMYPSQVRKLGDEETAPERPHPKQTVTAIVPTEPKGMKKFVGTFFEEGAKDIGRYLWEDLIVPSIKDTVLNALNYAFWGSRSNGGTFKNGTRVNSNGNVAYNKIAPAGRVQNSSSEPSQPNYSIGQLIFRTQTEADFILEQLIEYLKTYPAVPVAYLKECLTDENGNLQYPIAPTDEYIGWTNLNNVKTRRVSGGWELPMPRPTRISRH